MKTNVERVTDLMERAKSGPLMQAFVVNAIIDGAHDALEQQPWPENCMLSQDAWRACAKEALKELLGDQR